MAADPQLEAGRRCTQIKDSLERLVCFDRAFASAETPASAPAPTAAPPAVSAAPALGDEQLERPAESRPKVPLNAEARVAQLQDLPGRVYRITLDNDQVWDQNEFSSLFQVKVGDTVRIVKGVLGSYRMARTSHGTSGWVDVHRVR